MLNPSIMPSPHSIIVSWWALAPAPTAAHVTQPPPGKPYRIAMQLALADAHLSPDAIGYISAHGTAYRPGRYS